MILLLDIDRFNKYIQSLQHKLAVIEDNYNKEKEKVYFQEIAMVHSSIAIDYIKKYDKNQIICKTCQSCHSFFINHFSLLHHASSSIQPTYVKLCTKCCYTLLSSKSCRIVFNESMLKYESETTFPNEDMDDDNWVDSFNNYSLNFEYNVEMDQEHLSTQQVSNHNIKNPSPNFKTSRNIKKCNDVKLQENQNVILTRLQQLRQNPHISDLPLIAFNVKLIALQHRTQIGKNCVSESIYLNYFYQNILSQITFKTYDPNDLILKGEIKFIYEYWFKCLKATLECYEINIQEYRKRRCEVAKKVITCDKMIHQLNKNSKKLENFVGFRKNGAKWNQLVIQLKLKTFDFESLVSLVNFKPYTLGKVSYQTK